MAETITTDEAKSAAVKAEVEKDIAKAQEWMIKDEDIANARLVVGIDIARGSGEQTWVGPATRQRDQALRLLGGRRQSALLGPELRAGTRWGSRSPPAAWPST